MIQDTSMGNEVVSSQIYGSDLKMHNGLFGASSRPPFEVEESSNGEVRVGVRVEATVRVMCRWWWR